jgi:hypothetical protein
MSRGQIKVEGRSFEWLATSTTTLKFPAPLSHLAPNPEGFEFWWKMLEFVFSLPSPATFPALPVTSKKADLDVLIRYTQAAEELAQSELLSGRNEVTVHVPDESNERERVEAAFSSNEITRGFTVLFRQFHSKEKADPARFVRVHEILRQANDAAGDTQVVERKRQLDAWRKARASLLQENLKVRVGQKLRDERRMPSGIPGEGQMSPTSLITAYQYGDLIHWGKQRSRLAVVRGDPFQEAHQRMSFLEAVTGLAHIYIGFSLVVRSALAMPGGQPAAS